MQLLSGMRNMSDTEHLLEDPVQVYGNLQLIGQPRQLRRIKRGSHRTHRHHAPRNRPRVVGLPEGDAAPEAVADLALDVRSDVVR